MKKIDPITKIVLCVAIVGWICFFANLINENKDETESNINNYSYTSIDEDSEEALTKEEAEALEGTGYNGTEPNSMAEYMELKAAQVKCERCGKHSDNGANSNCDSCQSKGYY